MIPMITFACALIALIIAILHGIGNHVRRYSRHDYPQIFFASAFLADFEKGRKEIPSGPNISNSDFFRTAENYSQYGVAL